MQAIKNMHKFVLTLPFASESTTVDLILLTTYDISDPGNNELFFKDDSMVCELLWIWLESKNNSKNKQL